MAAPAYILFAPPTRSARWQVAVVTGDTVALHALATDQDAATEAGAAALAASLRSHGYGGGAVMLALPSAWCLAAAFATGDLPRQDRTALLYRFEEQLPLPAESMVADFVSGEGQALGVCARRDQVLPLVAALERAQVAVHSVCPAALLAASAPDASGTTVMILSETGEMKEDASVSLVALADGRPALWSLVPARPVNVRRELQIFSAELPDAPRVIVSRDVDAALIAEALPQGAEIDGETMLTPMEDLLTAAARAGGSMLAGRTEPWIDFRRGGVGRGDALRLHRRPLDGLLAAAAACAIAAGGALLLRAHRYDVQAQQSERQSVEAFRAAYPGWTTPSNVRLVLEAEQRKLAPARTAAAKGDTSRSVGSALRTLAEVLGRMPADVPVRVERMTFRDESFEMDGHLRSYEDAGALAAAARQSGLDVPPPQARREADGLWAFTLRGSAPIRPAITAREAQPG